MDLGHPSEKTCFIFVSSDFGDGGNRIRLSHECDWLAFVAAVERKQENNIATMINDISEQNNMIDSKFFIPPIPDRSVQEKVYDAFNGFDDENDNDNDMVGKKSITCQVEIDTIPKNQVVNGENERNGNETNANTVNYWMLYSLDEFGKRKSFGGDEFYIRYHEEEEEEIIEEVEEDIHDDDDDDEEGDDDNHETINQEQAIKDGNDDNDDNNINENNNNKNNTDNSKTKKKGKKVSKLLLQAVAIITDNNDGSYKLQFSTTPMMQYPKILQSSDNDTNNDDSTNGDNDSKEKKKKMKIIFKQVLTIHFEYSNGIGQLPSPTKEHWKNGGYSHSVYTITLFESESESSSSYPSTFTSSSSSSRRPPIKIFSPPNGNNNCIEWLSRNTNDVITIANDKNTDTDITDDDVNDNDDNSSILDLQSFDQVYVFGDSTMDQLVRQRPNKKGKYYFQSNIKILGDKVRMGLSTGTVDVLVQSIQTAFDTELVIKKNDMNDNDKKETNEEEEKEDDGKNEDDVVNDITNNNNNDDDDVNEKTETSKLKKKRNNDTNNIALIVGSCLWDILDSNDTIQGSKYVDHLIACREYVRRIRSMLLPVDSSSLSTSASASTSFTSVNNDPKNVTIIWKLPMAVHVHVVDIDRLVEHDRRTATLFGINRVRYMSYSRCKYLYDKQKQLMEELDIPTLDLFEATYLSSDQLYPSDGRHYRPDLNRLMLSWFYPGTATTTTKTNYHQGSQEEGQAQKRVYYQNL